MRKPDISSVISLLPRDLLFRTYSKLCHQVRLKLTYSATSYAVNSNGTDQTAENMHVPQADSDGITKLTRQ